MDPATYFSSNGEAVKAIVEVVKSEGIFDAFRKECTADVDTKPAYQNLRQRVEDFVSQFLSGRVWTPELNKNALRDVLRLQINQSSFLKSGTERVVNQLVNLRVEKFLKPQIEAIVANFLGIDPKEEKKKPAESYVKPLQFPVALVPPTIPQMPAGLYSFNLLEPPPPVPPMLPAPPRSDYLMPPLPPSDSSHPTPPPPPEDFQPPPPPSDDDMDISDGDDEASVTDQKSYAIRSDDPACADGIDQFTTVVVHDGQGVDVSSLTVGLDDYLSSQEGYSAAEHHEDVVVTAAGAAAAASGELASFEPNADCAEGNEKDEEVQDTEIDSLAGICASDGSVVLNNKGGEPGQIHSEDSMESADNHMPSHDVEKEVESGEVHTDDSKSSLLSSSDVSTSRRGRTRAGDTAAEQANAPSCRREVRRNRTRNRKYTSDEFTSIFSQKKQLLCDSYVADVVEEGVVEEVVTTEDHAVLPSASHGHVAPQSSDLDDDVALDGGRGRAKEPDDGSHCEGWQPTGSRPSSANSHESNQSNGSHGRSATRSKSDSGISVDVRPSPSATRTTTQRYDASDLYKPRVSHRKPIEQPSSPSSATVTPPAAAQHSHSGGRRRKHAFSSGDEAVLLPSDRQESDHGVGDTLLSAQIVTQRRRRSTLTTEVPVVPTPAATHATVDDRHAASTCEKSGAETGDIRHRGVPTGNADTRTASGGSHHRHTQRDGSERCQEKKHTFERSHVDSSSKKSRTKYAHTK